MSDDRCAFRTRYLLLFSYICKQKQKSFINFIARTKGFTRETDWYYYDPAVSQWLSVDPLAEKYPVFTPYNYVMNNPVRLVDPDGKKIKISFRTGFLGIFGKKVTLTYNAKNQYWMGADGKQYTGKTSKFADRVLRDLKKNQENILGNEIVTNLANDSFDYFIKNGDPNKNTYRSNGKKLAPKDLNIYYNGSNYSDQKIFLGGKSGSFPGYVVLGHEMAHKYSLKNIINASWFVSGDNERGVDEYNAMYYENVLRRANGLRLRAYYSEINGYRQGQILDSSGNLIPPPENLTSQNGPTMLEVHLNLLFGPIIKL